MKRLLILFVHLFFLSFSVYLRPRVDDDEDDGNAPETDLKNIIRYGCEVGTLVGVLSYVIFQQGDEIKNQGFRAFVKQLVHAPAKAIFLVSNFLILACIPFRIMGDLDTEEAILLFAVPGSWFLLMFFAGYGIRGGLRISVLHCLFDCSAVRLTGPFVTMIYSMITGDMFTFGIIYLIILFGFSQAFYFLYKGHPQVQSTLFHSYFSTWMGLFQTTLGDYSVSWTFESFCSPFIHFLDL